MITYKLYLWNGTDGYLNLEDGITAKIRVKKLDGGKEIKNIDYDLPVSELTSMKQTALQKVIDTLIAGDVQLDTDELAKEQVVISAIKATVNTKVKKIKTIKK